MNKLKKLGFKKVRGTEPGFHMYELTPAKLQQFDEHFKPQAPSSKPQAASSKRQALDKSK
jgi:Spy/CpxP family protein refolding chaperone